MCSAMLPVNTVFQSASPQWWLVGWVGSIALLMIGYWIALSYYDGSSTNPKNETPPDVDESPERGA